MLYICSELTLVKGQTPTQLLAHSASTGQGEKIGWKSSWVTITTREITYKLPSQTKRIQCEEINLIYCQLKYILVVRNKDKN